MAERTPLGQPQWSGKFANYSRVWTQRNLWRVYPHVPSMQDGMQECAVVFTECINRYWGQEYEGQICDNERWFMSLFQRALSSHWIGLSRANSYRRNGAERFEAETPKEEGDDFPASLSLGLRMGEASSELRSVMRVIGNAPGEVLELLFAPPHRPSKSRRLMRFAHEHRTAGRDVLGELHRMLTS